MSNPVDFHGAFMLNHMMPQFIVAVFTKSFLFGSFAQIIINFMIFNLILPPYPLEKDFALDLNLYFVLAQLFAAYAGVAFSNFLYLPQLIPLPSIKQFWLVFKRPNWGWGTSFKLFLLLVIPLNIAPRLTYDYGMSVFNPGDFLRWGLITTGILFVSYCITFFALRGNIGSCQPFYDIDHLQFAICVLFITDIFILNVFWCLSQFVSTRADEIIVYVFLLWVFVLFSGYIVGKWMYARDKGLMRILKSRMCGEIA